MRKCKTGSFVRSGIRVTEKQLTFNTVSMNEEVIKIILRIQNIVFQIIMNLLVGI